MKKIAVLASGQGTNLQAILEAAERGEIAGRVALVLSDRKGAYALERARSRGVKTRWLNPKQYLNRTEYDEAMVKELLAEGVDLVVLAGFMRLLSAVVIAAFRNRIINIHPSLLPAFPGTSGVEQALDYGVKVTGCTVHFVDEGLDTGPIILQEAVSVIRGDTAEILHQRIHAAEYRIYPRAIDLFCRNKLTINGRRCQIIE
ncbi:MAG: phosphoribosylglycinamide formyltransferase [Dethiobacter sp.]|nr:phosphoribosylglycinamide formyltransferase [Dethiobacter sp.]